MIFSRRAASQGEVIGKDAKVDLAVLRVKHDKPLPAVKFGDSDAMRIGDPVMAIGNPFRAGRLGFVGHHLRRATATSGQGPYDTYIQTDAAINKGNSGGPCFNMAGEVIGINTAILSPTGVSVGIGFAVPSSLAANVVEQLREFGETRRGWLGVRIQSVDDATAEALGLGTARGALSAGIDDKGPAKPAGLEVGDVSSSSTARDVKDSRESAAHRRRHPGRQGCAVSIVRKGKELVKTVKLGRSRMARRSSPPRHARRPNRPSPP